MDHLSYQRATRRSRRVEAEEAAANRACEWPGCGCGGPYRAPKSPRLLHDYRWFCFDHVRLYNASWNYYDGMSDAEVEADIRADVVWRRPSWPLGRRMASPNPHIRWPGDDDDAPGAGGWRPSPRPASPFEQALAVLELVAPVTLPVVKARYKHLVKLHHPDANGGAKDAEERFKVISDAYRTVVSALT